MLHNNDNNNNIFLYRLLYCIIRTKNDAKPCLSIIVSRDAHATSQTVRLRYWFVPVPGARNIRLDRVRMNKIYVWCAPNKIGRCINTARGTNFFPPPPCNIFPRAGWIYYYMPIAYTCMMRSTRLLTSVRSRGTKYFMYTIYVPGALKTVKTQDWVFLSTYQVVERRVFYYYYCSRMNYSNRPGTCIWFFFLFPTTGMIIISFFSYTTRILPTRALVHVDRQQIIIVARLLLPVEKLY